MLFLTFGLFFFDVSMPVIEKVSSKTQDASDMWAGGSIELKFQIIVTLLFNSSGLFLNA